MIDEEYKMISNDRYDYSEGEIQYIIESLKSQKGLETLNIQLNQSGLNIFVQVKDSNSNYYSIQIIPLFDNQKNDNTISRKKLRDAQQKASLIQNCQHSSLAKYYSDFQIGNYYFIQLEKLDQSLQQWIQANSGNPIQKDAFIKIAIQILEAAEYVHQKNINLTNLCLENIMINNNNEIRIYDIGFHQSIDIQIFKQKFQDSIQKNELFYLEYSQLQSELNKIQLNDLSDIWAIGICLNSLAGVSNQQIMNYLQGLSKYPAQYHLGYDINTILIYLLQSKKVNQRLSSALNLIQSFKNASQKNDYCLSNGQCNQKTNTYEQIIVEEEEEEQDLNNQFQIYIESLQEVFTKINQEKFDQSLDYIQACIKINPNNDILCFFQAKMYKANNMIELAISYYEEAIRINPKHENSYYNLANLYWDSNGLDYAINNFLKCVEIQPKQEWAYNNLGIIYKSQDKRLEAIDCYKKVIEINQHHFPAHYNLGILYSESRKNRLSLLYYKKSIKVNSGKGQAYNNAGNVFFTTKMYEKGIQYFQKSIKLCSENNIYRSNLKLIKKYI